MVTKGRFENVNAVATLLGGMLIVSALYIARDVFIPLTLAVLLSFLLSPIVNRIQRLGVPNVLAVLGTGLFLFVLFSGILIFVGRELSILVADIPHYRSELVAKARGLAGIRAGMGARFENLAKEVTAAIDEPNNIPEATLLHSNPSEEERVASELLGPIERFADRYLPRDKQQSVSATHDGKTASSPIYVANANEESSVRSWAGTVGHILGPLGTTGMVTVFVLFLLIYRDDMRDRIIKVISRGDYVTTTDALDEVSNRISKYLVAQTIVNTCYGVTFGLGLYIIGRYFAPDGNFPNYALWGALATALRFVPYIGPVIATSFPILLSIAVFPGYAVTIAVVSLIVVIELSCNNILEPWLYGASTGLSSVAIILAAVFWGWLWGPVGLLLSTPLTVCLVVLGRNVPRFRTFATLLGEKVHIAPSLLYYQCLLSNNPKRASEILESFFREESALKAIDNVLVPTLRIIRKDQDHGRLSTDQASEVMQAIEVSLHDLPWSSEDLSKPKLTVVAGEEDVFLTKPSVLAIPAHHANEELLLKVFASASPGLEFTIGSSNALPDRFAAQSILDKPDAIMIYVLPQGGFAQARYLCTTIRQAGYDGPIVVCCSGKLRNFDRLFVKFRKAGANFMTTNLMQTSQKLLGLVPIEKPRKNLAPELLPI